MLSLLLLVSCARQGVSEAAAFAKCLSAPQRCTEAFLLVQARTGLVHQHAANEMPSGEVHDHTSDVGDDLDFVDSELFGQNFSVLQEDEPCVKQARAHEAQCIPCRLFDPNRPCRRDATVIASMVFTPWHLCGEDGSCGVGRGTSICRRGFTGWEGRAQTCYVYNNGKFLRHNSATGTCISLPMKAYAEHNMGMIQKNKDDFAAAYKWSMEQRASWGDRPDSVLACNDTSFCKGQGTASGELGNCQCACTAESVSSGNSDRCTTIPKTMCTDVAYCNNRGVATSFQNPANEGQAACSCACINGYSGSRCEIAPTDPCSATEDCKGRGFASGERPNCECDCICWHGESCSSARPLEIPLPSPSPSPSPALPHNFEPVDGGNGRACRGDGPRDNSASYYQLATGKSLEACKSLCAENPSCMGIEYWQAGKRCEIWTRRIGASASVSGFKCFHLRSPCSATVFQHGDFSGWSAVFPEGDYPYDALVAQGARNDDASSIKVVGEGCTATLYQHHDFSGWHASFSEGDYTLEAILTRGASNDDTSSIIVSRGAVAPAPLAFQPVDGGVDRACRGQGGSEDNSPTYYHAAGAESLDACKARCAATLGCHGVEWGEKGRCETWTAPVGSSKAVTGFTCLRVAAS